MPVSGVQNAVAPVHGSCHSTLVRTGSWSAGPAAVTSTSSTPGTRCGVTSTVTFAAPTPVARTRRPGRSRPVSTGWVVSVRPDAGALPSQLRGASGTGVTFHVGVLKEVDPVGRGPHGRFPAAPDRESG